MKFLARFTVQLLEKNGLKNNEDKKKNIKKSLRKCNEDVQNL